MSTHTSGIEGVSARYAAQIRELLFAQAIKREAARIEARREAARAAQETQPTEKKAQETRPVETRPVETPETAQPTQNETPDPRPTSSGKGAHVDTIA